MPFRLPIRAAAPIVFLAVIFSVTPSWAVAPTGGAQTLYTVPHVPAQLLVKREPGVPPSVIEQILAGLGGTILDFADTAQIDVVGITDDNDLAVAVALLEADARIEFAEPNFTSNLWATPNDLDFAQQWSKDNNGLNAPFGLGHAGADMNLVAAWDTQSAAPSMIIAIIDDSMETTHVDLFANVMTTGRCFASPNSSRPCTNGPSDPNPVDAKDFHGTMVAGAAAARGNNGIGIAGAVWETNLLPLKVDLSYFAIVEAIDEAITQQADIINMSFGGPAPSQSLSQAIDRAEAAGILMIASAGNADANNDIATHHPSNAHQPNVLSVASSDSRDRISGFSQWGSASVHLAAPGDLILTTSNGNNYATVSGTSFSAPHTAGVAALVYESSGSLDYRQVKAHLLHGTSEGRDALGPVTPGQDDEAVPGRVLTGRLDADKALAGPPGGVLLVTDVAIDDTATGNGNRRLDPGETARLDLTLTNVWTDEVGVSASLSSPDSGMIIVNDVTPVVVGDIIKDAQATAGFSVTLSNAVTGNEQLFMQLDSTSSTSGTLPTRYFYLEVGTLRNGQSVTQSIQRNNWDEFQAFHIDVPAGASDLNLTTAGAGDVDLLVRFGESPQYLISLNASGTGYYYVDSDTSVSAGGDANETVSFTNPLPGTYHAVVVNYDQQAKSYDVTASYTLPTAGTIEFSQGMYSVDEAGGTATISVIRAGGVGGASVEYGAAGQTATAGDDFAMTGGTLSWGLGENGSKTFVVPIVDDQDQEPTETLQLTLSNVNGATLGQIATATLEIADDDTSAGAVVFSQSSYTISEAAAQATVTVLRTGGSLGAASVDFSTTGGTAGAGSDFVSATGTLSWADGESGAKTIAIDLVDDAVSENAETFSVSLSNPQGAAIGAVSSATVTISDDDTSSSGGGSGGGGAASIVMLLLTLASIVTAGRRQSPAPVPSLAVGPGS